MQQVHLPDATATTQPRPAHNGTYASLTGPGETATPGDLTQAGGFKVKVPSGDTMGFIVATGTANPTPVGDIQIVDGTSAGLFIEQVADGGIFIQDTPTTGPGTSSGGITLYEWGNGGIYIVDIFHGSSGGILIEELGNGTFHLHSGPTTTGGLNISQDGSGGIAIQDDGSGLQIIETGSGNLLLNNTGSGTTQLVSGVNTGGIQLENHSTDPFAGISLNEMGLARTQIVAGPTASGIIIANQVNSGGLVLSDSGNGGITIQDTGSGGIAVNSSSFFEVLALGGVTMQDNGAGGITIKELGNGSVGIFALGTGSTVELSGTEGLNVSGGGDSFSQLFFYATSLASLHTPSGGEFVWGFTEDGHIYFWNGSSWTLKV